MADYYATLGVSRDATQADIKQAYRKLSKELHPDKHKGDKDKEKKFKEVNEAYEVLSNEQKRKRYDQFGSADGQQFGGGGFQGNYQDFDFSQFGGGFGDLFENFFGGGRRTRDQNKGKNVEFSITIPFSDAISGQEREIEFLTLVRCTHCDGTGAEKGGKLITCETCSGTGQVTRSAQSFFGTMQQTVLCPTCHGSGKVPEKPCHICKGEGRVREKKKVKVNIPAGIQDGQSLRIRGEGEAGRQGAAAGDLYLLIHLEPDVRFQRDGDDIRSEKTISLADAALGTEADVDTVQGFVKLSIPAGTQPHQLFRIKGKGMPVLGTHRFGDHYVTMIVEIPKKLSREERKLFEELRGD